MHFYIILWNDPDMFYIWYSLFTLGEHFTCFLFMKFENSNEFLWDFVEMSQWLPCMRIYHARLCTECLFSPQNMWDYKTFHKRKLLSDRPLSLSNLLVKVLALNCPDCLSHFHLGISGRTVFQPMSSVPKKNMAINISLYLSCTTL